MLQGRISKQKFSPFPLKFAIVSISKICPVYFCINSIRKMLYGRIYKWKISQSSAKFTVVSNKKISTYIHVNIQIRNFLPKHISCRRKTFHGNIYNFIIQFYSRIMFSSASFELLFFFYVFVCLLSSGFFYTVFLCHVYFCSICNFLVIMLIISLFVFLSFPFVSFWCRLFVLNLI